MKKRKIFILQVLCILSIFISIPVFTEAQVTNFDFIYQDADGKCNYEPFELFEYEKPGYSRTELVQMPGWPQTVSSITGVSFADVNEDGFLEIILGGTDGSFHVWDYLGYELPDCPQTGLNAMRSKAAVGDFDPDYPGLEIIAVGQMNTLYAWHNDGTAVEGWPVTIGETFRLKSPVLFDIDGDGFLEIILGQQIGQVIVFNRDGTIYPGWPQQLNYLCVATPAVGDLDNDGEIEICALSYNSVYLWDKDGVAKPGFPLLNVAGGMSYAQPVFADLDDDGDMEILFSYYTSADNYVGIYHHDGSVFENWPKPYPGPQTFTMPIPGDIDNDDDLEIFGGGHGQEILERHHTGDIVAGWPVDLFNLESSPIIFDLDNDGEREIVFGDNQGSFHAYNGDGSIVEDWPILSGGSAMVNSAAVGDVDGDGDIEIALVVNSGTVNLWTIEDIPYKAYLTEWGTWFHDNWNTGWFHPRSPQNLTAEMYYDSVDLNWNANTEPDIAGYNVYRSETSGGPYTKLNNTLITDTSYNYISDSEDNYYCVTAEIKAKTESRLSTEVFGQVGTSNEQLEPLKSLSNYNNPFNPSPTI